jgi:hypothetical protein
LAALPRLCRNWRQGSSFARSPTRDEATQRFLSKVLDCFAEPVIGPATSGRTRWLATTGSTGTHLAHGRCSAQRRRSANRASRSQFWSSRRPRACRRCPTRSGTSRPQSAPALNRRAQGNQRTRLSARQEQRPIVSSPISLRADSHGRCAERSNSPSLPRKRGRVREGANQAAAARLPKRCRFAFCFSLRGGSLNSRAAVPPRMLCLPFSDRNGRSQIVDGRSKSQCG